MAILTMRRRYENRRPLAARLTQTGRASGVENEKPLSGGRNGQPALAFRREGDARPDVLLRQSQVFQHFRLGHAASQIFDHIGDGDAKPANAWLAAALARFDCEAAFVEAFPGNL